MYRNDLLPPVPSPSAELLAQAALFVFLRDRPQPHTAAPSSPWASLASRRFGGDLASRTITLQAEGADATSPPTSVLVTSLPSGLFDIAVHGAPGVPVTAFHGVSAQLTDATSLTVTLGGALLRSTVVPQVQMHPGAAPERLHVFHGPAGAKTTLVLPLPGWLASLDSEVRAAAKGALRAPMPSLVVEVRVKVGEHVEKGQAVVVLESMKTETVLRAGAPGVVKAVGCAKGEMVEEGRELVDIDEDGEA